MTAYRLNATVDESPSICGHVGGSPQLSASTGWPRCRMCDSEMVAFIELVLPQCDTSPFQLGSRLQVFGCCEHNDIAGTIYSDYTPFETASLNRTLPIAYWNITDGHYFLRLLPPSETISATRRESRLIPQFIVATPTDDDAGDGFKMFGEPYWLQDPEPHTCSCGAQMMLLLQIPENYGFPIADGAEEQPDSFSRTDYCIFLGNQLYVLACTSQCDPRALWPVLQN